MIVESLLCTYTYTVWNSRLRISEGPFKVAKSREMLTTEEKGPRGCTPCEQDQITIGLSNGVSFRACRHYAAEFKQALDKNLTREEQ